MRRTCRTHKKISTKPRIFYERWTLNQFYSKLLVCNLHPCASRCLICKLFCTEGLVDNISFRIWKWLMNSKRVLQHKSTFVNLLPNYALKYF